MTFVEQWENCTAGERDLFRRSCRRLLKSTFVVRDKDEHQKKAYYFLSKRQEMVADYLRYIGFDITVDRENGVIMLRNAVETGESGRIQSNRLALRKVDSIILCSLWNLYADRLRSGLMKNVTVTVAELRFELEKFGVRDRIDKGTLKAALALFRRFNLLDVDGNLGEPDCRIRLYPSMQFVLDTASFQEFVEEAGRRMSADLDSGELTEEGAEEQGEEVDEDE